MVAGSVSKIEVSWDDALSGNFPESPTRKAFREAVEATANKARTAIPDLNGRTEKAIRLVLSGDVSIAPDGQGLIGSQSNGSVEYLVGKGDSCSCKDHPKAPKHLCKHLLAYHIYKRATALAREQLQALDAHTTTSKAEPVTPTVELPTQSEPAVSPVTHTEAPASANVYIEIAGRKVQLTLRDTSEEQLLSRMEKLLTRFPAEEPASTTPPEGWCSKHGVQMKLNHSKRGSWWSHKTVEGWCNHKQ